MRQEIIDYAIIGIRSIPALIIGMIAAALMIRITTDNMADVWLWIPVLLYILAYLVNAEDRWSMETGGETHGRTGKTGGTVAEIRAASDDGRAA